MQDAHADVVLWSSWTSFFSNSLVSIVLVSGAGLAACPPQPTTHALDSGASLQYSPPSLPCG